MYSESFLPISRWSKFSNSLLAHSHKFSPKEDPLLSSLPLKRFSTFSSFFSLFLEGKIMSSKSKSSIKSRRDRSVPEGFSSQHVGVVPKVEFSAEPIDPEEVDAWRTAMGEVKRPVPVVWVPPLFKTNPVAGCPSRSCPNGLAAIRHFCRISESVEFCLPEDGEVAQSPPEGYFMCYET